MDVLIFVSTLFFILHNAKALPNSRFENTVFFNADDDSQPGHGLPIGSAMVAVVVVLLLGFTSFLCFCLVGRRSCCRSPESSSVTGIPRMIHSSASASGSGVGNNHVELTPARCSSSEAEPLPRYEPRPPAYEPTEMDLGDARLSGDSIGAPDGSGDGVRSAACGGGGGGGSA